MMFFMPKSKKCAKRRLINCIKGDRETLFDSDGLKRDIESILSRYAVLDGRVNIEIIHKDRNKRYIQAEASIKI